MSGFDEAAALLKNPAFGRAEPRAYEDPERFDADRPSPRHLALEFA